MDVKRELLSSTFEGYKLNSKDLTVNSDALGHSPLTVPIKQDCYSFIKLQLNVLANNLFLDPFHDHPSRLYYFSDGCGIVEVLVKDASVILSSQVCHVPADKATQSLSPSMYFVQAGRCLVSNGCGQLFMYETTVQTDTHSSTWKLKQILHDSKDPFLVSYACGCVGRLHVLVVGPSEQPSAERNDFSVVRCQVDWLIFEEPSSYSHEGHTLESLRSFFSTRVPKYLSLDRTAMVMVACSERPLEGLQGGPDSTIPTAPEKELFSWSQTSDHLYLMFTVPEDVRKKDITAIFRHDGLLVQYRNGDLIVDGNLEKHIIFDACRWTIDSRMLAVMLIKKEPGVFWTHVFQGNLYAGKHIMDGEELEHIQRVCESLESYTSDCPVVEPCRRGAYNAQELEECDACTDSDSISIQVFGRSGQLLHQLSPAGDQVLFTTSVEPCIPLQLCLRYDVDGLVWSLGSYSSDKSSRLFEHVATFNALGYVLASKSDQKFVVCARNYSFVAVSDASSRIFIYQGSHPRDKIACQYVVSLRDFNDVRGCLADAHSLFLLGDEQLQIIRVHNV